MRYQLGQTTSQWLYPITKCSSEINNLSQRTVLTEVVKMVIQNNLVGESNDRRGMEKVLTPPKEAFTKIDHPWTRHLIAFRLDDSIVLP